MKNKFIFFFPTPFHICQRISLNTILTSAFFNPPSLSFLQVPFSTQNFICSNAILTSSLSFLFETLSLSLSLFTSSHLLSRKKEKKLKKKQHIHIFLCQFFVGKDHKVASKASSKVEKKNFFLLFFQKRLYHFTNVKCANPFPD